MMPVRCGRPSGLAGRREQASTSGPFAMKPSLEQLARQTGEVLLPYYGRLSRADATSKGGRRRDLVSRADVAAEAHLLAEIPSGDGVIAEESGRREGGGRLWIVDPLDGTVNFLHGLPLWCVSIAVVEDGRLVEAAVHAPALDMTFTAAAGAGAQLNGAAVTVSDCADVRDAILATGFPYARDTVADNNLENVPRVGAVAGGLRRMGSAALDLALTAAGRLDGFWELHLNPWDVAAGALLVREAGGSVTDFSGDARLERVLEGRNIVATNGRIHDALRGLLAPLREL
jgi:myo-inositol-1(or 4)-monophosphatase